MATLRLQRPPSPQEWEEQVALFERVAYAVKSCPDLQMLFHVPNGAGYLSPGMARRFKAMGVQSGVPDICMPVPKGGFVGLWVELKRKDACPSDTSQAQHGWHRALRGYGYRVEVCKGWEAAWAVIMDYLGSEENT
jgi:hypothetical protein